MRGRSGKGTTGRGDVFLSVRGLKANPLPKGAATSAAAASSGNAAIGSSPPPPAARTPRRSPPWPAAPHAWARASCVPHSAKALLRAASFLSSAGHRPGQSRAMGRAQRGGRLPRNQSKHKAALWGGDWPIGPATGQSGRAPAEVWSLPPPPLSSAASRRGSCCPGSAWDLGFRSGFLPARGLRSPSAPGRRPLAAICVLKAVGSSGGGALGQKPNGVESSAQNSRSPKTKEKSQSKITKIKM